MYTGGIGRFDDGRIAEDFINGAKVGSAAEANAQDAAIVVSLAPLPVGNDPSCFGPKRWFGRFPSRLAGRSRKAVPGHGPMSVTRIDARKILSLFEKRECISLKEAAHIAGKSEATMRNWCDEFRLGRRTGGGPWSVSRAALMMHLDGDRKALKAFMQETAPIRP
jgi:hypothetical protein